MLGEYEDGVEALRGFPHYARGVKIQLHVGFVPRVEENGRVFGVDGVQVVDVVAILVAAEALLVLQPEVRTKEVALAVGFAELFERKMVQGSVSKTLLA